MAKQWKWDGNPCDYDPGQETPWLIDDDDNPILKGIINCCNLQSANLIAAAPELLEALQACLDYGSMTGSAWVEDDARAAIAKATGQCLKGEE